MKFRTEIEPGKSAPISHDDTLLMLGSCFTTNIGEQLLIDGFNAVVNPTGVLYNPASIAAMLNRAMKRSHYTPDDLFLDNDGTFHALDFPNNRRSTDAPTLLRTINEELDTLSQALERCTTLIITFGTAHIFERADNTQVVGNCHKLPAAMFNRRRMSVDEIVELWSPLIKSHRVIFTVSPIRHLADGLHGNTLSKATLLLATDTLCGMGAEYFPSYEIMMDDLRDYRFYAPDMKHPSEVAVKYIYESFRSRYFSPSTEKTAEENRKNHIHSQHRPLL